MTPGLDGVAVEAMLAAADPPSAGVWRSVARQLAGPPVVVVAATDGALAARAARRLGARSQGVRWEPLEVRGEDRLDPAVEDRVLAAHAIVWVTPVTAAVGAEERRAVGLLELGGAPRLRRVVIVHLDELSRLSDDPDREREELQERVRRWVPWELVDEPSLDDWTVPGPLREAAAARRVEVARRLVHAADEALAARVAAADAAGAAAQASAEASATDEAAGRRAGARIAAHVRASARRRTDDLLLSLAAFFDALEANVPEQVEAVADLATARRALAPWLQHVVEAAIRDGAATWRAAVHADLDEVGISGDDLVFIGLVPPSMHPGTLRDDPGWSGARLGATAVLGGGVVLSLVGLWIPGLAAVGGGLIWGALAERAASATSRLRLVEAAQDAVRRLARDADGRLRAQGVAIEAELERWSTVRTGAADAAWVARREGLVERHAQAMAARATAEHTRTTLRDTWARLEASTDG